jgi:excisionase family DNA binding protein
VKRTPDDNLTTTEAAQLLHCSRQHVADMCERGQLPHIRIGKHRRIPRAAVERLLPKAPRREDERSLWINIALAAKLIADPVGVLEQARERLRDLRQAHSHGRSDIYLNRWERALDDGPDAVLAIMTDRSDTAAAMRSTSPLSGLGLLSDEERAQVLAAHRAHWRKTHGSAA